MSDVKTDKVAALKATHTKNLEKLQAGSSKKVAAAEAKVSKTKARAFDLGGKIISGLGIAETILNEVGGVLKPSEKAKLLSALAKAKKLAEALLK